MLPAPGATLPQTVKVSDPMPGLKPLLKVVHPCELDNCRCERPAAPFVQVPGEEKPRCFECGKPVQELSRQQVAQDARKVQELKQKVVDKPKERVAAAKMPAVMVRSNAAGSEEAIQGTVREVAEARPAGAATVLLEAVPCAQGARPCPQLCWRVCARCGLQHCELLVDHEGACHCGCSSGGESDRE